MAWFRAFLRRNGRQVQAALQFGVVKLDRGRRLFALHDQEFTLTFRGILLLLTRGLSWGKSLCRWSWKPSFRWFPRGPIENAMVCVLHCWA